jgi:hypothetical protein
MMGQLGLGMSTYLGRKANDIKQAFALEDERSWALDEEGDELEGDELEDDDEDVIVEDPSELIGLVKRL